MGCWNETCLFSRLPITCGQKIVCVFIIPAKYGQHTVYADDQYVPLSLPFRGRYDDYGRIEDITYDEAAIKSLANTPLRTEYKGGWTSVDPPRTTDPNWGTQITNLADMARQEKLWAEDDSCAEGCVRVRLAFIHEDLWDYAMKYPAKNMASEPSDPGGYRWPAMKGVAENGKTKPKALRELVMVNWAMNLMRVAWQPTCGTGSQSCIDYRWQVTMYRKFAERANAFYHSGDEW